MVLVIPKLCSTVNPFISAVLSEYANILLKRVNKCVGCARKKVEKKSLFIKLVQIEQSLELWYAL